MTAVAEKLEEVWVTGVPKEKIHLIWPQAKESLSRVEEQVPRELSMDDLLQNLLSGQMQLWFIAEGPKVLAFFVTKLVTYSHMKGIQVLWLAGEGSEIWLDKTHETLIEWGKSLGASRLELIGRKGWQRVLAPYGWEQPHVVLHKEF